MNIHKNVLPDINWERVYDALGVPLNFGNLFAKPSDDRWYVFVLPGVTRELVLRGLERRDVDIKGVHLVQQENPDHIYHCVDDRPKDCTRYRIEVRRQTGPDPEYLGTCPKIFEDRWIGSVSLLEMLLLQFGFLLETGKLFDCETKTICSGSRLYFPHDARRGVWTQSLAGYIGDHLGNEEPRIFTISHDIEYPAEAGMEQYGIRSVDNLVPCRVT